jgi:hypothetical protein
VGTADYLLNLRGLIKPFGQVNKPVQDHLDSHLQL